MKTKDWPHAPVHRLDPIGIYMVTGGTLHKQHFFKSPERLDLLENNLLSFSKRYGWQLEAWAVFVNHYHFVARGRIDSVDLDLFLKHLHADCARQLNELERSPGREIWHNFWETKLTYEKSYLARLNYVHQNPVKHCLVNVANQYPWCSAGWFERTASLAAVKTIYSFQTDLLRIPDDY